MKKILSVFVFFLILAGSSYAKEKEPMSYTINLSEIAPKITFQQNNGAKYADQAMARIDITRHVKKLIGRSPIVGDTITIIYEGSFKDYVYMNDGTMFIGLIDDSEQANWYKELAEYTTFSKSVSQNEQFSTSVTFVLTSKPVMKCVIQIGFHTTPELAKKNPKLIATVKTTEKPTEEKPVEVEGDSDEETKVAENQLPETTDTTTPSKSWYNMMNVAFSFPQTSYTVTEIDDAPVSEKNDTKISTFDAHYAWLPTLKNGLTFKLGMDYGMGFVQPEKSGDDPAFVKNDIELLAGVGFTFGSDKFRFRILGEFGFGALSYNFKQSYYVSPYTLKNETNVTVIYVPVGVDISMNIFFGNNNAVGLYIGSSFHAIPMMDSSSSTVTKMTSGGTTTSTTSYNVYTIDSPFRFTPAIGVILTL